MSLSPSLRRLCRRLLPLVSGLLLVACDAGSRAPRAWAVAFRFLDPDPRERFAPPSSAAELETSLTRWAEHGFKIDVDHEWRSALPAHPDRPVERRLSAPAGAELRFAYSPNGAGVAVELSVEIETPGGARELFRRRLEPAAEDAPTWHEARVDLGLDRATEVALRLLTRASGLDPLGPLPVWGHPEVLAPTDAAPPDVVLISVDTLGAGRMSLYGYERPTTPALERWAHRRAVVFERAIAAAPWTLPSHVSMLTGLDAVRHGVNFDIGAAGIPAALETLAERLRAAGYATLAITGGGFVHPRFGFADGFDRYRYWPTDGDPDAELESGLAAARTALEELGPRPLLLFFHTYEVHGPNHARQPYFSGFSRHAPDLGAELDLGEPNKLNGFWGEPRPFVLRPDTGAREPLPTQLAELPGDLYDSAIAYADERLGAFLDQLETLRGGRRALVVLSSDHGEALGTAGRWNHVHLSDDNLLVPLLVALPEGRGAGRRIARQVRAVDLVPTILEVCDLPSPTGLDGRSLLALVDDPGAEHPAAAWSYAASSNRGLALRWDDRLKYVFRDSVWPPVQGGEQLFDLRTDPHETRDASASSPRDTARLRELVRERLGQATAVRLRLANAGVAPLGGRLESHLLDTVTVKSADLPPPRLQWAGRGRARFEVPAAGGFTLLLEHLPSPRVELAGVFVSPRCPAPVPFTASWELAELSRHQQLAFDDRKCRVEPPRPGEATTGLTAWWSGLAAPDEAGGEIDPDLERQLRALGYLGR